MVFISIFFFCLQSLSQTKKTRCKVGQEMTTKKLETSKTADTLYGQTYIHITAHTYKRHRSSCIQSTLDIQDLPGPAQLIPYISISL